MTWYAGTYSHISYLIRYSLIMLVFKGNRFGNIVKAASIKTLTRILQIATNKYAWKLARL